MNSKEIYAGAMERYLNRTQAGKFNLRAALIDMDGTLIDSMKGHSLAWYRMTTEIGMHTAREEFYLYEGMTGAATIDLLFHREFHRPATPQEQSELYARKTGYFNELPRVPVIDGAPAVVEWFRTHGIQRVLVTGSGQESSLSRLANDFPGGFPEDMRVTASSVKHGKPAPDPYLKGMELASVAPWEAMAVENAPLGVKSASAAGAFTVAVTTGPIPEEEMWKAGADLVVSSMEELLELLPLFGK